MKDFSKESSFDLNCLLSIELGNSEKWVNKHSDHVIDYCEKGVNRQIVIDSLFKIERAREDAKAKFNANDWMEG